MHALAMVALLSTSCMGECRSDDCGRCYKPHSHSVCRDWESYWCNLAKPCDFRLMCTPWPLEYPGARGIGWMAEGTAVTKDFPINVGPHAVQVVMGENGVPKAIRRPIYTPPPITSPASPPQPNLQSDGARHQTDVASQSRYRLVE
jgi:hypothetical protein